MSDRTMTNEEAAAILESEAEFLYAQDEPFNRQAFKMAIEALQERKTGKWIAKDGVFHTYNCSLCGRHVVTNNIEKFPYCHCGAKMEVE